MIIYSNVALTFLREVRAISLKILKFEMNLPFERKRLKYKNYFYPLDFVVFEHPTILGQYIPGKYQIQINKNLIIRADQKILENIIRHELCHYLAHIRFGTSIRPHGAEFQSICQQYNYGPEVSLATIEISSEINQKNFNDDKIYHRIKKLFALSNSENSHEAELATIKANELLKKHHLQFSPMENADIETVLAVVLTGSRVTAKHEAIYSILKEFLVAPVFNYQRGQFSLEVIGLRSNVLTAEYVAVFLDQQLEKIYTQAKSENPQLKGSAAKKSFMQALANAFIEKIKSVNEQSFTKKELIVCKNQIDFHLNRAYPRLRGRYGNVGQSNELATSLGTKAGKNLSINPGVSNNSAKTFLLE